MQPKTEVVRLRVTPELKEKIQAAAEAENRTVSNYIETAIIAKMEENMKNVEMIENLLEEEMTTYIVINSDGRDEWISYEGTDLEEAKRIARLEFGRNEKSKQKYTVELREMADDYESGSDAYNYDLVEFIEVTWHDLSEKNLTHSYHNGDGTSDLQFDVKGKTVFVRNVPTPEDADEWYWDDKKNVDKAVAEAKEIEIH